LGCEKAPPGDGGRGFGRLGDGVLGLVTCAGRGSVGAGFGDRGPGGFLVDDGVVAGECCGEGVDGEVVHGAGIAAGGVVDQGDGVGAEQGVGASGDFEVVGDVVGV
jgi:hypothetical protein